MNVGFGREPMKEMNVCFKESIHIVLHFGDPALLYQSTIVPIAEVEYGAEEAGGADAALPVRTQVLVLVSTAESSDMAGNAYNITNFDK